MFTCISDVPQKSCHVLFFVFLQSKLGLYDFTFGAWPVDYKWDESKAEYVHCTVYNLKQCHFKLRLQLISIQALTKL